MIFQNLQVNKLSQKRKKIFLNSKVMNALFYALDKKDFRRVSSCKSAQEI